MLKSMSNIHMCDPASVPLDCTNHGPQCKHIVPEHQCLQHIIAAYGPGACVKHANPHL